MIDNRVCTFLELTRQMNYRRTAEALNMTQPAVTQHIQALESEYGVKLFHYDGRRLTRTAEAEILARYARAQVYNEAQLREALRAKAPNPIHMGATKTIGDYVLPAPLSAFLKKSRHPLELMVDNMRHLLEKLDAGELDFIAAEGIFDRERYASRHMREEPFIGLCPKGHPFDGHTVKLTDTFAETLVIREEGSGTRGILEQMLALRGYTVDAFHRRLTISSFPLITTAVAAGAGISFAYRAIADSCAEIGRFTLQDMPMIREFNYVYLAGTDAEARIDQFLLKID